MFSMILKFYCNIFSHLRSNAKFLFFIFLILAELIIYCIINCDADISQYLEYTEITMPEYKNLFSFIFFENLKSSAKLALTGFIPFFLGILADTFLTAYSLTSSIKFILGEFPANYVFLSLLPHGLFEMSGLIFCIIISAVLSKELTLFLLSFITKKKFDNPKAVLHQNGLKKTIIFFSESFVFVVTPLILLGAIMECTITSWVMEIIA